MTTSRMTAQFAGLLRAVLAIGIQNTETLAQAAELFWPGDPVEIDIIQSSAPERAQY